MILLTRKTEDFEKIGADSLESLADVLIDLFPYKADESEMFVSYQKKYDFYESLLQFNKENLINEMSKYISSLNHFNFNVNVRFPDGYFEIKNLEDNTQTLDYVIIRLKESIMDPVSVISSSFFPKSITAKLAKRKFEMADKKVDLLRNKYSVEVKTYFLGL